MGSIPARTLITYSVPIVGADGEAYRAKACGRERDDGDDGAGGWIGWIEFERADGELLRTARETTQPNHDDLVYWATGLTTVYLEGALDRAAHARRHRSIG